MGDLSQFAFGLPGEVAAATLAFFGQGGACKVTTTHDGGCHCGALRFRVKLDLTAGTEKCNCTICIKMRLWSFRVLPSNFEVRQGAEVLRDYTYGTHVAHHYFCATCGIHAFDRVDLPGPDGTYFNVAVVCVDGLDIDALTAAPIQLQDGLHDDWGNPPNDTRLL